MLAAHGRMVYRRRWPIVVIFLAAFAAAAMFAPRASELLSSGGFEFSGGDAVAAGEILATEFQISAADPIIIFRDDELTVDDDRYRQAVADVERALSELPFVRDVESYLDGRLETVSADRHVTYLTARVDGTPTDVQRRIEDLRRIVEQSPIEAVATGLPIVSAELAEASERDLVRAELISAPLVVIVLVVVFGATVAAAIPLVLGFMSIAISLAAIYGLSQVIELSVFVTNIATMLGLAIGIDYSLLLVSRFREELRNHPVDRAVEVTVARAGKAILFSGVAVAVGLSGLLVFEMNALRSIGIGGIVTVTLLVIGAMTLVPVVLSILGPRVDRLAVPWRLGQRELGAWASVARWVMRFAIPILVVTVTALLVLGSPFLRVRFGVPGADVLPPEAPARVGLELLEQEFNRGALPAVVVTVTDPEGIERPENLPVIDRLSRTLAASHEVSSAVSITTAIPGLNLAQVTQLMRSDFALLPERARDQISQLSTETTTLVIGESTTLPNDERLQDLVRELRGLPTDGLEIHVGGEVAILMDFVDAVFLTFPWAIALILGISYVVLFFLFGSVLLPLKAVLMNALSITAAYGALVFVFQDGNLSGLLGFEPRGFVDATLPVLLFCVLFGLSMDYEVFLLSRVRESWERTRDNTESVADGLQRTGGIITGAAAILIVVSAGFGAADIVVVKALGVGIALAIFVDATIVRILLMPSTMRLLGRLNWWAPGPLARLARLTAGFAE